MSKSGPGRSNRQGIGLYELLEMFPDEESAHTWFERRRWPDKPICPHCGSDNVLKVKSRKPMPYRCRSCRKHFSVRTETVMAQSKVPLRKWAIAVFLYAINLKSVSSMKLHRDLKVTQKTAWFMAHRIRKAMETGDSLFAGPTEADETYMGGKEKNKHADKKLHAGRGTVGKVPVAGLRDRATNTIKAKVVPDTRSSTLQGFVTAHTTEGSTVLTDDAHAYKGLPERHHRTVRHSVGEYVNGMASTNGIESFWAGLKRGYHGTFHHFSAKHMQLYIDEFATRHGLREHDTIDMMGDIVAGMIGKRLTYKDLIEE